jgi:aspartate kinase
VGVVKRRILKFGGTSVAAPAVLDSALGIVERALAEAPVVVVVSALSGVTNALEAALAGAAAGRLDAPHFAGALRERHLALLEAVASGRAATRGATETVARLGILEQLLRAVAVKGSASAAERAWVLAIGERLSAPIVAAALRSRGRQATAFDAAALIRTDAGWSEAAVDFPATRRLVSAALGSLPRSSLPVVTGFVGGTEHGETTLLGRGGSDYTAGILGFALDAERVEIWSDVPGVMSGDPRKDASARTLPRLSYAEAGALARAGAKVLHPRTLEPLEPLGIPVFVGSTLDPGGPGTWIGGATLAERARGAGETAA